MKLPPFVACFFLCLNLFPTPSCLALCGNDNSFNPARSAVFANQSALLKALPHPLKRKKRFYLQDCFETVSNKTAGLLLVLKAGTTMPFESTAGEASKDYCFHLVIKREWCEPGWPLFIIVLGLLSLSCSLIGFRKYNRKKNALAYESVQNLKQAIHGVNNSKKDLEQKLKLYTHLLASIFHDIRTPLGFISLAARGVKKQLEAHQNEKVLKTNEMIAYTSDEMMHLVENLSTFMKARIYGGQIPFEKVNLRGLVQDKTSIFSGMSGQQGALMIDIAPDIFVSTQASLLGIIIHNLVDNALKVEPFNKISLFSVIRDGKIQLVIRDHGPGMPAPLIDWLSGSPAQERQSAYSSGLGLVIVREICQMLGIKIRVENLPGACIYLMFDA